MSSVQSVSSVVRFLGCCLPDVAVWRKGNMQVNRYIGIDFSGAVGQWRASRTSSNVWISEIVPRGGRWSLRDLRPVQGLKGEGAPFDRLTNYLCNGDFTAASIDAPFSLPRDYVPKAGHGALLERVMSLPHPGRPFPSGPQLIATFAPALAPNGRKLYREIEQFWRAQGLNVRSTLWWKPRGGAPMTAACLTLLARAGRPIWPWADGREPGLLVEAFPAAQLKQWGLPFQKYSGTGPAALDNRRRLLRALSGKVDLGAWKKTLLACADPLDAVLAAFAGIAVHTGRLTRKPEKRYRLEGAIAVHV